MCHQCGYVMDAASPMDARRSDIPVPGDVAACMNCGVYHTLVEGGLWRPLTVAEWRELEPETKRELTLGRMSLVQAGFPDLAKRGSRA
jgi:hypothetical protein